MSFNKDSSDFSVVQYLQNAILQLCNEQVSYTESLHVLGVLCITADNEQSEFVIKINSTLKRLNSLTPPKDNFPGYKSKSLLILSPQENDANDLDNVQIISHFDDANLEMKKVRGRKQSKPAKVKKAGSQGSVDEKLSLVDEDVVTVGSANDEYNSDAELLPDKTKSGFDLVLPSFNASSSFNNNNQIFLKNELSVNTDVSDNECLDLSSKTTQLNPQVIHNIVDNFKINYSSNNNNNSIWSVPYPSLPSNISTLNLPLLQMGLLRNGSLNEYVPQSFKDCFNTFMANQPTVSSYRKILPATDATNNNGDNSNFKQQSEVLNDNNNSNNSSSKRSFNDMIIDKFESKTEEDYMLDCLNVNGRKRRRRSLEDALTLDEIHEYLGSRDRPMEDSYTCKVCDHVSLDLLKYFHHTLTSHKSFICHQCGRCFTTKSSLLRHRPIHTGLRRFACSICQKAFYRKDKCKAHIKKHAEVQGDSEASNNVQVL